MNVAVLYNEPIAGKSDSVDVLDEVRLVTEALDTLGYPGRTFGVKAAEPLAVFGPLGAFAPDVVFNLVESLGDVQRFLPVMASLFELSGLPFTGSPYDTLLTTTDKVLSKAIMAAGGIPTAEWQQYRGEPALELSVPLPVIVKPSWEDASVGIDDNSVIYDGPLVYPKVMELHAAFRQPILIERYIDGREFNISLIEHPDGRIEALPPAEMTFRDWPEGKPKIVNYRAKWDEDAPEYGNTIRRFNPSDAPLDALWDTALESWRAFDLRGYARIDMRVDDRNNIFIVEANANPCITSSSGFIAAAEQAGYRPHEVIDIILKTAMRHYSRHG